MAHKTPGFRCAFAICLFLASCAPAQKQPIPAETPPRSRFHLGDHHFAISTENPDAQEAFDRALTLAYAFNHRAAEREFREAARLDPAAPMPWWGVALVNGPHINFALVPPDRAKVAWEALSKATSLGENGTAPEKDLIEALHARYREHQPKDRQPLDIAYAGAMRLLWTRYPTNADVGALYAESLMDLHPWDLWTAEGTPKPWTPEILEVLEAVMRLNPKHPGANHFYVHAVEASNTPERGVPSADTLMTLVPGAGHLVHMPAHIYARVDRWEDAAQANENAILADNEYRLAKPDPGFYALYMLHNHHFLAFTRMMQGQKGSALQAGKEMLAGIPPEFMRDFRAVADGFFAITSEVLMRFGDWEQILREPAPPDGLPVARSMWRFARTSAFTATDRFKEAREERARFVSDVRKVPKDATFGNNRAHTLLDIARLVIDGEMAARQKKYDPAIRALTEAVSLEDSLTYDEPPDWILPVRHALGAVLLNADKPKDAERVYREDLRKFSGNGWALYGLRRALELQGRGAEAQEVRAEFDKEWANADINIDSSCLCQHGA